MHSITSANLVRDKDAMAHWPSLTPQSVQAGIESATPDSEAEAAAIESYSPTKYAQAALEMLSSPSCFSAASQGTFILSHASRCLAV